MDWDKYTIVGTSQQIFKDYLRLTTVRAMPANIFCDDIFGPGTGRERHSTSEDLRKDFSRTQETMAPKQWLPLDMQSVQKHSPGSHGTPWLDGCFSIYMYVIRCNEYEQSSPFRYTKFTHEWH